MMSKCNRHQYQAVLNPLVDAHGLEHRAKGKLMSWKYFLDRYSGTLHRLTNRRAGPDNYGASCALPHRKIASGVSGVAKLFAPKRATDRRQLGLPRHILFSFCADDLRKNSDVLGDRDRDRGVRSRYQKQFSSLLRLSVDVVKHGAGIRKRIRLEPYHLAHFLFEAGFTEEQPRQNTKDCQRSGAQ